MEKIKDGWTEAHEAIAKEMKAVTEERINFRERLKQAEELIVQLRKERNYWHNEAMKGGGNG